MNEAEAFVECIRARVGLENGEINAAFLIASVSDQLSSDCGTEAAALVFGEEAEGMQFDVMTMLDGSEKAYRRAVMPDDRR